MNSLKSSTRTLLGNDIMNILLEVKLNEPSIKDFSPATAIMHWLENGPGKRHIGGHKTKEQSFYNTYTGYTGKKSHQCIQYDKTYSDNIFVNIVIFCKYRK